MKIIWDGPLPQPDVRMVADMAGLLSDPDCPEEGPLYFMFRDLAKGPDDHAWLEARAIRYDITVIPPRILCGEYVKTKGHFHPLAPGNVGYPELYQVLSGEAVYLLQDRSLSSAAAVRAFEGEAVLIPPGYGHVTINPSRAELVMANLVSSNFASVYQFYEEHGGAMYYLTESGWEQNPRYPVHQPLRELQPPELPALGIRHQESIYDLVGQDDSLRFLTDPAAFRESLAWF
jgi:glucose-6-phosphate isomerase